MNSELFEGYDGDAIDSQQLKQDNINHKLTSIGNLRGFTAAMASTPVDRKERTRMMRDPKIPARRMFYRKPSNMGKDQVQDCIDWLNLHKADLPAELDTESGESNSPRNLEINIGSVESREADRAIQDASREDASVGLFYMEGISAYKGRTAAFFEALRNPNLRGYMHTRGLSDAQVQLYLGEVQAEAYRKYAEHKAYMLRWRGMQEFRGVTRAIEEEAKGVTLSKAQSNAKDMPSQERLNELLSYDPETGTLVWATARRGVRRGSRAYTVRKDNGKVLTRVDSGLFATARVVYTLVTGIDPKEATIHCINGDLSDLRWDNLMLETTSNVVMSSSAEDRARLGYDTKYRARVMVSGKAIRIGDFDTEEEAESAKSLFIKTLKRQHTPLAP